MERKAVILCVGTELTTGKYPDTNGFYLARELYRLGIRVREIIKVPDDHELLAGHLTRSLVHSSVVILTGGLGPTPDDMTKDAVKDALGLTYVYSRKIEKQIRDLFRKLGWTPSVLNKVQARVFSGARVLPNRIGTAPGHWIEKKGKVVILLPGPPPEMKLMFEQSVRPFLKKKFGTRSYTAVLRMYGAGESAVAESAKPFEERIIRLSGEVTYLSSPNLVDIIVTGSSRVPEIKEQFERIRALFQRYVYSGKWESLYSVLARDLIKKKLTLCLAESCTGGLISKVITDSPGSSKFFLFDVVCYSDQSKQKILNVRPATLKRYGAVSRETALEMLSGLARIKKSDLAVSVTGIAGPKGGTIEKPVGTVWIGISHRDHRAARKYRFTGGREKIREAVLNKVFELVHKRVHGLD
jgi:nicotinamide-nucleotide amidase